MYQTVISLRKNAEEVKTAAALQPGESISAAVTYVSTENVKDGNSSNGGRTKAGQQAE